MFDVNPVPVKLFEEPLSSRIKSRPFTQSLNVLFFNIKEATKPDLKSIKSPLVVVPLEIIEFSTVNEFIFTAKLFTVIKERL